jgi:hypothetical protein
MKCYLYDDIPFCEENLIKKFATPNFMLEIYMYDVRIREKVRYDYVYDSNYIKHDKFYKIRKNAD